MQSILLAKLHRFAQVSTSFLHVQILVELEVLPLERDGVVEEELRAPWSSPGTVSKEKFQWRALMTLVNMKETLWAKDFGNMANKVESA